MAGKAAVITGGAGTIGLATAKAFARAGIKHVALVGRKLSSLKQAKESLSLAFPQVVVTIHNADTTTSKSIKNAMEAIRGEVGQTLDILVLCAGFLAKVSSVSEYDPEEYLTAVNINVSGSFLTTHAFMSVADSSATIINVSSGVAHLPLGLMLQGIGSYAATKAGAANMFEFIQMENPGMKVISIQPGIVESDMNRKHGMPAMDHGKWHPLY